MIVYCFNDRDTTGQEIRAWVQKHGAQAQIVTHAQQIESGEDAYLFAYMPEGPETEFVREFIEDTYKNKKVKLIPSIQAARWHGRKVDQYVSFGQWMPTAWLIRSDEEMKQQINDIPYPVLSVANSGEGRVLHDAQEALIDATECLHGGGFALESGKFQKGYVYWTIPIQQPSPVWRVIMFAQKYAIPVLMGDKIYPMDVMSSEIEELLQYCWAFFHDNRLKFGSVLVTPGMDVMRGVRGPYIEEYFANWPRDWFMSGGMIFETKDNGAKWESTGIPAVRWYDVVAKAIVNGEYA
jgi:hypothetical protein